MDSNSTQLTQAKGLRQSIDINSHLLCFDHTAGQRECLPFWNQIHYHKKEVRRKATIWETSNHNAQAILFAFKFQYMHYNVKLLGLSYWKE